MPLGNTGVGLEMPAPPAQQQSYTSGGSFWGDASSFSAPAAAPAPAPAQNNPPQQGGSPPQGSPAQDAYPAQRGGSPPQYVDPNQGANLPYQFQQGGGPPQYVDPSQTPNPNWNKPPPPGFQPSPGTGGPVNDPFFNGGGGQWQQGGNPPQYTGGNPPMGNAPSGDMWNSFNPQQQQWLQQLFGSFQQQQYSPYNTGYNPYNTGYNPYNTGYNPYNTGYNPYNTGYNPALFTPTGNAPSPFQQNGSGGGFGGAYGPTAAPGPFQQNGSGGGFGGAYGPTAAPQQQASPMSYSPPPWAQSQTQGWSLPGFTGQGGYAPMPNIQQWNSMLPSEQQATQQANQSITGMQPADFYQNLQQSFPSYYGATPMRYSGY